MVKKVLLIVFGLIAFLIGLVITSAGAALLAVGGSSGTLRSGYHAIATPTYGFVSDPKQVRSDQNQSLRSGAATLLVDARGSGSDKPLFIGIGPTDQVDRYLTGTSYDTVTRIDFGGNFDFETTRVPGSAQPAAPGDQTFWLARATGVNPQMRWPIANGDYRVVVMNADATAAVSTDVRLGLRVPGLYGVALGLTIGGGLLALLGLALTIWGIAAKRSRAPEVAGYPGYGQPSGYPPPPAGYPATPPSGYPAAPPPGSQAPEPPGQAYVMPPSGHPYVAPPATPEPGQPPAEQPGEDTTTHPATYRRPPDDPTRPPA